MYGRQEQDRDFRSQVPVGMCSAVFPRPNKKRMRYDIIGVNGNVLEFFQGFLMCALQAELRHQIGERSHSSPIGFSVTVIR